MTLNINIPQSTDVPSQSQGQLLANFVALNTIFNIDHVPFTTSTSGGGGKHKWVQFSAYHAPTGATAAGLSEIAPADRTDTAVTTHRAGCIFSNQTGSFNLLQCWAWVKFGGAAVVPDLNVSYNVSSVTKLADGRFRINFTNALPSTNYMVFVSCQCGQLNGDGNSGFCGVESTAVGSCVIETLKSTNTQVPIALNSPNISVMVIGWGL